MNYCIYSASLSFKLALGWLLEPTKEKLSLPTTIDRNNQIKFKQREASMRKAQ